MNEGTKEKSMAKKEKLFVDNGVLVLYYNGSYIT